MSESFSQQVKKELCAVELGSTRRKQLVLATIFANIGVFRGNTAQISTGFLPLADIVNKQFYNLFKWEIPPVAGGDIVRYKIENSKYPEFKKLLADVLQFVPFPNSLRADPASFDGEEISLILRYLFVSFGSICDPHKAYHVELTFKRQLVADFARRLLSLKEIEVRVVRRSHFWRIYIKDAQLIVDFLGIVGAHVALLTLENLRLEKEVRNSVNRVVNCDSANSKRVAATSVRQLEAVGRLRSAGAMSKLSPDLQRIAELRLENPELSLRELGELLDPPLGKSGVNHRLSRLEQLAAEIE